MKKEEFNLEESSALIKRGIKNWLLKASDVDKASFLFLGKCYKDYKEDELREIAKEISIELSGIYIFGATLHFNPMLDNLDLNCNFIITDKTEENIKTLIGILKLKGFI